MISGLNSYLFFLLILCGIYLSEIFRSQYASKLNAISHIGYQQSFFIISPDIWDICPACYSHSSTRFCSIFVEISFLCTYCLIRCLIRLITFPKISKNQHNRMIKFCADFYISSSFFNVLDPFPNQFYNSGQRLDLLKWL